MENHPIEGLMKTAMENIKEMVDVNTIVGDPVESPDGSIIIPVSKVGFGFVAGGTEFDDSDELAGGSDSIPFGGGSGGGVSITPIGFLVVGTSGIRLVPLESSTHLLDRILELTPQFVDKLQEMFQRDKKLERSSDFDQEYPI